MSFTVNPILACDFYKVGHKFQYPEGTEMVYSNFTPRSTNYATKLPETFDGIVNFGLQGFIKSFLIDSFNKNFFARSLQDVLSDYKSRCDNALGIDSVPTDHIESLHKLGYLPLEIKALPEGELVPVKVPVLTVKNTLPEFFWLTNYIETVLSTSLWRAMTSATTAYQYRKLMQEWAVKTGSPLDFVLWQGHDFSLRGMGGLEDGAVSGAGHLCSFLGTDTIPAMQYLEEFYSGKDTFIGGSVPATEHAVMCVNGQADEIGTFKRLITEVYPSGIVSIVSDTWDFWKVITEYTVTLKDEILNRTPNALGMAKVVFRPDSGNPADILCGLRVQKMDELVAWEIEAGTDVIEYNGKVYYYEISYGRYEGDETIILGEEVRPEAIKGAVECLWDVFGGTVNSQGYKVLNERVGLIYGDSITLSLAKEIFERLEAKGFASCNTVLGIGSYTYCYQTRDSLGFAMKATYGVVNGAGVSVEKNPVTDSGTKKSAKGLLRVELENDTYVLYDNQTPEQELQGELQTVFKNGVLTKETNISEIRNRLNNKLK